MSQLLKVIPMIYPPNHDESILPNTSKYQILAYRNLVEYWIYCEWPGHLCIRQGHKNLIVHLSPWGSETQESEVTMEDLPLHLPSTRKKKVKWWFSHVSPIISIYSNNAAMCFLGIWRVGTNMKKERNKGQ